MKALLLAAGLGTRLKPFTFLQAKASIPFLNAPLIHYPLQYLAASGIDETIINLHAHPDSVRNAAGDQFQGMTIHYSHEAVILGTAGAMAKASSLLGSELLLVMNSDMICDIPLNMVLEQHKQSGNLVTLVVMDAEKFPGYNPLYFDPESLKITGFQEGDGVRCHYTGLQIVDPAVVEKIPADRKTEIFQDIYPELTAQKRIGVFFYDGLWLEMGTLQEYLKSSMRLSDSLLPSHLCPARMNATLISPDSKIESGANVVDTIIMEGTVVKEGVRLERCIVGAGVYVKQNFQSAALARGILPWYF